MSNDIMYSKVIDFLKEDGAFVNFYEKYYDEEKTNESPSMDRGLFKKYNDEISLYHKVLKYLTGEVRANITESIPVIDYNIPSNTSLTSFYKDDYGQLDPSKIYTLNTSYDNLIDLQLAQYNLKNPENSLINRAIVGQEAAKLFYNTTSDAKTDNYLLVDDFNDSRYFYHYKGLKTDVTISVDREKIPCLFGKVTGRRYIEATIANMSEGTFKISDSMKQKITNVTSSSGNNLHSKLVKTGSNNTYMFSLDGEFDNPSYVFVFPRTTETAKFNKILILIPENNTYKIFSIYSDSRYDSNINFLEIEYDGRFPEYINHDIVLDVLKEFCFVDKIYYSSASGLLNGYFSYPLDVSEDGETVEKWAFLNNDSDGRVKSGYDFFSGYILNRGTFINSPTQLSSSDKVGTSYTNFTGKLSYYYDMILKTLGNMFSDAVQPIDNWKTQFNKTIRVGSIVRLYDLIDSSSMSSVQIAEQFGASYSYMNETMTYPNKCKIPLTEKEFPTQAVMSLFNSFKDGSKGFSFSSDWTTLTININSNNVISKIHAYKDFDGWIGSSSLDTSSAYSTVKFTDYNVYSKSNYNLRIEYNRVYRHPWGHVKWWSCKSHDCYDFEKNITNVSIDIASPFKAFNRNKSNYSKYNNDTILIYPQSDSYLPQEMILLSKNRLNITTNKDHSSVVTFSSLNNEMISYRCVDIQEFKPSNIKNIIINDNVGGIKDYICSDTSELYNGNGNYTFKISSKGSGWNQFTISSEDCYLYRLSAMKISIGSSFNMYDRQNVKMTLSKDVNLTPVSYPDTYFKVDLSEDNDGTRYMFENTRDSYSMINTLLGSRIIIGLPKESEKDKVLSLYNSNNTKYSGVYALYAFYKYRSEAIKNNILSKLLKNICLEWPITENSPENNPLKIKDIPSLVDGLSGIRDVLYSLYANNIKLILNSEQVSITKDDFTYLSYIVDGDIPSNYTMEITEPTNKSSLADVLSTSKINFYIKNTINNKKTMLERLSDAVTLLKDPSQEPDSTIYKYIDECLGNETGALIDYNTVNDYHLPEAVALDVYKAEDYEYHDTSYVKVNHNVNWEMKIINDISHRIGDYAIKNVNGVVEGVELANAVLEYFTYKENKETSSTVLNIYKNIIFPTPYISDNKVLFSTYSGDSSLSNNYYVKVTVPSISVSDGVVSITPTTNTVDIEIQLQGTAYSSANAMTCTKDYIPFNLFESLVSHAKKLLDGTDNHLLYLKGYNNVIGNSDSLYYKRYKALNSRMNTLTGNLYMAGLAMKSIDILDKKDNLGMDIIDSFSDKMLVIPIHEMGELYWLPEDDAVMKTEKLPGKLYNKDMMERLRETINNRCVLTCRSCAIKSGCPFYNEDEVVKMYVPEAEFISFTLKDNKLNLVSDIDFDLHTTKNGTNSSKSWDELNNLHKPWASITKYYVNNELVEDYYFRKIEEEENKLKSIDTISYTDNNPQGLGWLTKARYGTINSNIALKQLENTDYDSSQLYDYQYLYNALFIPDEQTYFKYKTSNSTYDVSLDICEPDISGLVSKSHYEGSVRLNMPYALDFSNGGKYQYSDNDLLFLVSDDEKDEAGNDIVPLIFINTLGAANENIVFDLNELGNKDDEINNIYDTNIYAKDVAQWSVNILKGDCAYRPVGTESEEYCRDQYWMSTLYKKVLDGDGMSAYASVEGRKRAPAVHSNEILCSLDNVNEIAVISGKPVVGNYTNFLRSFMLNTNAICWVHPMMVSQIGRNITYEQAIAKQKSTLPCMKTNLRFVLMKGDGNLQA